MQRRTTRRRSTLRRFFPKSYRTSPYSRTVQTEEKACVTSSSRSSVIKLSVKELHRLRSPRPTIRRVPLFTEQGVSPSGTSGPTRISPAVGGLGQCRRPENPCFATSNHSDAAWSRLSYTSCCVGPLPRGGVAGHQQSVRPLLVLAVLKPVTSTINLLTNLSRFYSHWTRCTLVLRSNLCFAASFHVVSPSESECRRSASIALTLRNPRSVGSATSN